MKKIGRFLLLSFSIIASVMLFGYSQNVEAKSNEIYKSEEIFKGCQKEDHEFDNENANFWQIICAPYQIENNQYDTAGKYTYNDNFVERSFNFSFQYDYKLVFNVSDGYIKDGTTLKTRFYGIGENTSVTFKELSDNPGGIFRVYKYRAGLNNDFELITNYSETDRGNYYISEPGLYKLETYYPSGGTQYAEYIVYEKEFYYSGLREITYNSDDNEKTLNYKIELNSPYIFSCNSTHVNVNEIPLSNVTCSITTGENYGDYIVTLKAVVPANLSVYNAVTYVSFNGANYSAHITYDCANPELTSDIVYYPFELEIEEFALYYNGTPLSVPNGVVAVFSYEDDSDVEVTINDRECQNQDGLVRCFIDSNDGGTLLYKLSDSYGNTNLIAHVGISYNDESVVDSETLREYLTFERDTIRFSNLEEYPELSKICLVYGDDIDGAICDNATTVLSITSYKYYVGKIHVILADDDMNVYNLEYNDVTLNNGYDIEDYIYSNIEGNIDNKHEVTDEIKELIQYACDGDVACLETVKVYLKYGVKEKVISDSDEFEELLLPTYLEMLNTGFTTSSCAFSRCNEEVEVYVSYNIGGVSQKISAIYRYVDKLPQIDFSFDIYSPTRSYDFSEFNVNSITIRRELFTEQKDVTLTDGYGNEYDGVLNSRIIQYTDRSGNVVELDNLSYTYLANNKNFGYYLLEGYITYENGTLSGKSFFISVEIADKKPPVLEFIGSSTMELKQYDVFKDPEFKCNDGSGCTTWTEYYYENFTNPVDKIDTAKSGTYLIKYSARDGDGNVSELVRTVIVESVNAMNLTSILIIVSVVIILFGSIILAIIMEKKKNREEE